MSLAGPCIKFAVEESVGVLPADVTIPASQDAIAVALEEAASLAASVPFAFARFHLQAMTEQEAQ